MKKPRIVIADEDYGYISSLQLKIVEEMFDKIELEIITDKDFFSALFRTPQAIDILVVSEELYSDLLIKHDIAQGFILTEDVETIDCGRNFTPIYKYSSVKEIFSVISGKTSGTLSTGGGEKSGPRMILVTSAIGGVGKTTIAMGIASVLAKHMKNVLYINNDYLQNFQALLINQTPISDMETYMHLASNENQEFQCIKHLIRTEDFSYVPPFKSALLSLGINHGVGLKIAKQAIAEGMYDYVIIDADSTFDVDKMDMFGIADTTIFVTTQNEAAVFALNNLIDNLDLPDKDKFILVCNQFSTEKKNAMIMSESSSSLFTNEYVDKIDDYWEMRTTKFSTNPGIQKIAMMIL